MKKITLIGTASFPGAESKSTSLDIIWDEFLPIVRFKEPSEYEVEGEELIETKEKVTLSKHLNRDKSTFKILQITTENRKLKLPFTIKKGNSGSKDDDGFIDLKISEKDEDIKIISKPQIKAKYNTDIEIELKIGKNEDKEFYLDFYARDDTDDWNVGEYTNVHCGRIKIIHKFINLKEVFYAISLMQETDYRSNNFRYYKDFIKVKNSAFSHIQFGEYLSKESEELANDNSSGYTGEEIKFLAIFSHGYENNIFGDSNDVINTSEIDRMFSSRHIRFAKDSIIFLGACNSGTGKSSSFAQKLAEVTNSKVIGMVDDGVAVVSETTGSSSNPKMIYGPKYGNKYNGKFYEFRKGQAPKLLSKEVDIIQLVETLKKIK